MEGGKRIIRGGDKITGNTDFAQDKPDGIPTVATLPSGVPERGNKPVAKHYAGRMTEPIGSYAY